MQKDWQYRSNLSDEGVCRMNAIIAPIGGGGNHIRWLCLLDQSFDLKKITEKDKFDFILNDVYNDDRNWHNWLQFEWTWRDEVDNIINHQHYLPKAQKNLNFNKILYINANGENCYKHYIKFNSSLNGYGKYQFIKEINVCNIVYEHYLKNYYGEKIGPKTAEMVYDTLLRNKIADESMKTFAIKEIELLSNFSRKCFLSIDFDSFYKNPLDNKIIKEINEFFSIDIPFDQATEVHNKWISLNKKAELEIVDDLKKLYGN